MGVTEANHIATVHDPWGGVRQFTSVHLSNLNNGNPVEWEFDIDAGFFILRSLIPPAHGVCGKVMF